MKTAHNGYLLKDSIKNTKEKPGWVLPTLYDGIHFRSRTEARWAVYFNTAGIEWEYEPEGFHLVADDDFFEKDEDSDTAYLDNIKAMGLYKAHINYLPDFKLRLGMRDKPSKDRPYTWFEVKGVYPDPIECLKARLLGFYTGCPVVVAVGPPYRKSPDCDLYGVIDEHWPGNDYMMAFHRCPKCGLIAIDFHNNNDCPDCEIGWNPESVDGYWTDPLLKRAIDESKGFRFG